jgi:hypothetical protein
MNATTRPRPSVGIIDTANAASKFASLTSPSSSLADTACWTGRDAVMESQWRTD